MSMEIPGRGYCAEHIALSYDKRRGNAVSRGYDDAWSRLSSAYRKAIGNRCEITHAWMRCTGKCDEVHHIESVEDAPSRRLDWSNLVGLCRAHHRRATAEYERTGQSPTWCRTRVQ